MPRPAEVPGKPRKVVLSTRTTPEGAAAFDRARGKTPRADALRDAVAEYVKRSR